jgi:histidinol-phosphate phosphatase family protein
MVTSPIGGTLPLLSPASVRPTQAVIVAGGRGSRLRPLTDDRPKPMIKFHGRPFLEYLVELLRDQGFERQLLLLGYRAESIIEHFGTGEPWGVELDYHVSDPEIQTGRRAVLARDAMDEHFLFLYCDNYWPMRWDAMWQHYREAGAPAMITVYRNADGYSRANVRTEGDLVAVYDRSRAAPGLQGVEIGFAILPRTALDLVGDRDVQLEEAVYPPLAAAGQLSAFVTDHRYHSVGSLERLPRTEAFLARTPTVILDRDGVLNLKPPRAQYVTSPEAFIWAPGALDALVALTTAGFRILVVSNQAGIARDAMTRDDLAAVEHRMAGEAEAAGARIERFYYCPHGWDEGCECRKPRPGMLIAAQRDYLLDLTRTPFVGDDERDAEAADAAGAPFYMVDENRGLLDVARDLIKEQEETR